MAEAPVCPTCQGKRRVVLVSTNLGTEDEASCPTCCSFVVQTSTITFEDRRPTRDELVAALEESVKLQSHYATNLNSWDGGERKIFASPEEWIARLKECRGPSWPPRT